MASNAPPLSITTATRVAFNREIMDEIFHGLDRKTLLRARLASRSFLKHAFDSTRYHLRTVPSVWSDREIDILDACDAHIQTTRYRWGRPRDCGLDESEDSHWESSAAGIIGARPILYMGLHHTLDLFKPGRTHYTTKSFVALEQVLDCLLVSTLRIDVTYPWFKARRGNAISPVVHDAVYFKIYSNHPFGLIGQLGVVPVIIHTLVLNIVLPSAEWMPLRESRLARFPRPVRAPQLVIIMTVDPEYVGVYANWIPKRPPLERVLWELGGIWKEYHEILIVGLECLEGNALGYYMALGAEDMGRARPELSVELHAALGPAHRRTACECARLLVQIGICKMITLCKKLDPMFREDDDEDGNDGLLEKLVILSSDEYRARVGSARYGLHTCRRHIHLGPG